MGEFRYIPADEVAKRHRAQRSAATPRQKLDRQPVQRNVESVLALGDVRYITFHNRVFCIPSVPFKLGERVLDSYTLSLHHAKEVARTGNKAASVLYFAQLSKLAGLLWSHVRPTGKIKRFFWRIGLLHNPFRSATEMELKAITDFFLQGRMTSSVRSISEMEAQA